MKTRLLLFLLSFSLLTSCKSVQKYNQQITKLHTPKELCDDTDAAYSQLKKYHPKLYQYISKEDLDFKFDSLKATFTRPLSSKEYYEKLSPVISSVRQGHLIISPPMKRFSKKEKLEYFENKRFSFNLMDFEYLDERLRLNYVAGPDSVLIGSEVLLIDEKTPKELIRKYNSLIASDGYNTTFYQNIVGSRFPRFYLKNEGFQDSIRITFKQRDSIFTKILRWEDKKKDNKIAADSIPVETAEKIAVKKLSTQQRKAKRAEERKKRDYNRKRGYVAATKQYTRTFSRIGTDSLTGYIQIRSFSNGNPEAFYKETFNTIDSLGINNLIIDLRNNGGGSLAEITDLYSYLTDRPFIMVKPSEITTRTPFFPYLFTNANGIVIKSVAALISPFILTHNLLKTHKVDNVKYYRFKQSKEQRPKEKNFTGNLYVLINGNSFSASSILSAQLKAANRATFVGQETGGAYNGTVAGIFKMYELKNSKVVMRVGMMQIETYNKVEPDGYGVKADKVIVPTYADREAGIDPEIEWVLNEIKNEKL